MFDPLTPPSQSIISSSNDETTLLLPRSIRWRIDLNLLPPTSSTQRLSSVLSSNVDLISAQRERYEILMQKHLWECSPLALIEQQEFSEEFSTSQISSKEVSDPLSAMLMEDEHEKKLQRKNRPVRRMKEEWERELVEKGLVTLVQTEETAEEDGLEEGEEENRSKWSLFHMSRETLSLIEKDLHRLPPHHFSTTPTSVIPPFSSNRRDDRTQLLSQILFVYSKEYPSLGYRQGMHEILSLILLVLEFDFDSFAELKSDSRRIGHDAYALFEMIMYHLSSAYDASSEDDIPMPPHCFDTEKAEQRRRQQRQSMHSISQHVVGNVKRNGDSTLYHLLTEEISLPPQIYCTKWIRLMFAREISSLKGVLQLWDAILDFSFRNNFMKVLECTATAMILNVKHLILKAEDGNEAIHVLMNYPPVKDVEGLIETVDRLLHGRRTREEGKARGRQQSQTVVSDETLEFARPKQQQQQQQEVVREKQQPVVQQKQQPIIANLLDFAQQTQQPIISNLLDFAQPKPSVRHPPQQQHQQQQPVTTNTANIIPTTSQQQPHPDMMHPLASPTTAKQPHHHTPTRTMQPIIRPQQLQQTVQNVSQKMSKALDSLGASIAEAVHQSHPKNEELEERLRKCLNTIVVYLQKEKNVPEKVWDAVREVDQVRKVLGDGRNGGL